MAPRDGDLRVVERCPDCADTITTPLAPGWTLWPGMCDSTHDLATRRVVGVHWEGRPVYQDPVCDEPPRHGPAY